MKNIPFVIWMIFYPLAGTVGCWIDAHTRLIEHKTPSTKTVDGIAAIITLAIYFFVAGLLYRK